MDTYDIARLEFLLFKTFRRNITLDTENIKELICKDEIT